jgi:plastocyanin
MITISACLLAISYFLIFAASYYQYGNAMSGTVGAGGDGDSWDKYTPQNITINAGENVTWTNPMKVVEPHTVTFVKDKEMIPLWLLPLAFPIILNLFLQYLLQMSSQQQYRTMQTQIIN